MEDDLYLQSPMSAMKPSFMIPQSTRNLHSFNEESAPTNLIDQDRRSYLNLQKS